MDCLQRQSLVERTRITNCGDGDSSLKTSKSGNLHCKRQRTVTIFHRTGSDYIRNTEYVDLSFWPDFVAKASNFASESVVAGFGDHVAARHRGQIVYE